MNSWPGFCRGQTDQQLLQANRHRSETAGLVQDEAGGSDLEASGGPCKYTGKDMKSAHTGTGITSADFNALVEDLLAALDKVLGQRSGQKCLIGCYRANEERCRREVGKHSALALKGGG